MAFQNPVIVIPGITASELLDDYPMRTETVWSMVLNKHYERLSLHPDDLRYEAIEPAHLFPGRAFGIYDDLVRALRHELSQQADKPTPVFAFPYDWRVDVRSTADRLGVFVEEVLARTRLLRHYEGADDLRVDLVGHSMGGLIICHYLTDARRSAPIGKVATLGTPYLGSIEAIVKITTGMSLLTGDEPREREREAARVTPAVYQLFPSYENAAIDENGDEVDLFAAENMQTSIMESISEYVRLYSVGTRAPQRAERALAILEELLAAARATRDTVRAFSLGRTKLRQTDWLAVIGVGQKTRIQMSVEQVRRGPRFIVNEQQFVNGLTSNNPRSHLTGDGTVPLGGALPPFLPRTQPVCVTEDDLGFFELRDRVLVELGGLHGLMPKINLVQRLVTRHLRPDYRGKVWGRRVPAASSWNPPIEGLADDEKTY